MTFYAAVFCWFALAPGAHAEPSSSSFPVILGVGTLPISEPLQDHLGSPGRGVLVDHVVPGSAAEHAGMASGDVLVSVAGKSVHDPQELTKLVWNYAGETVEIGLVRDQMPMSVRVSLDQPTDDGFSNLLRGSIIPHVQPGIVPDGFPQEIKAHIEEMQRRMQRTFDRPLTPGGTMRIERSGIQCESDASGTTCVDLDGNPIDPGSLLQRGPTLRPSPDPESPDASDPLTDRLRALRDTFWGEDEAEDGSEPPAEEDESGMGGPPA